MPGCPNVPPGVTCLDPTCANCNPFRYRRLSSKLVQRWGYHLPIGHGTYAHWCLGCEGMRKIQYLGDCTHIFKGSTIELPDIPIKALANSQEIP